MGMAFVLRGYTELGLYKGGTPRKTTLWDPPPPRRVKKDQQDASGSTGGDYLLLDLSHPLIFSIPFYLSTLCWLLIKICIIDFGIRSYLHINLSRGISHPLDHNTRKSWKLSPKVWDQILLWIQWKNSRFFQSGYRMGLKSTLFLSLQDPLERDLCLLHTSHWKNPARKGRGFSTLRLLQGIRIPLNFYFNINQKES